MLIFGNMKKEQEKKRKGKSMTSSELDKKERRALTLKCIEINSLGTLGIRHTALAVHKCSYYLAYTVYSLIEPPGG